MSAALCGRSVLLKPGCDRQIGPLEGFGILVVPIDERADVGFELPDRGMNAALEALSGELSEPALDLINPRRRNWREVDVIMRPPGKPCIDLGVLWVA